MNVSVNISRLTPIPYPVKVIFTKNNASYHLIGDTGEYGQRSEYATGSFTVFQQVKAISIVNIVSGGPPPGYNCNTVIGDLGDSGGMFKVEVAKLPPGGYSVNITIYAVGTSTNNSSASEIRIFGPDGRALMSGFGHAPAPFRQKLTFDVPVTPNSSGTAFVVSSVPRLNAQLGGNAHQTVVVKVNSIKSNLNH